MPWSRHRGLSIAEHLPTAPAPTAAFTHRACLRAGGGLVPKKATLGLAAEGPVMSNTEDAGAGTLARLQRVTHLLHELVGAGPALGLKMLTSLIGKR